MLEIVEKIENRGIRLFEIEKQNSSILCKIIEQSIEKGSIIYAVKWNVYISLNTIVYEHYTVTFSKTFKDLNLGIRVHININIGNLTEIKKRLCISRFRRKNFSLFNIIQF